ncbi:MAG: VacJ family lipoprotein [Deltaproteobacteria bacterium]|nr:VacJ family lipoprotein [Deltaproteobacteria bacterium]
MKAFSFPVLLFVFFAAGCAHSPDPAASLAPPLAPPQTQQVMVVSDSVQIPSPPPETPVKAETQNVDDYGDIEVLEKVSEEAKGEIADPLEPFNRAMYHFNDKLYFWVLRPVAQGYGKVVPEAARIGVSNFFANLAFPIRFVNCLLQANFEGAAAELGRFTVNTLWGIGGLLDPASSKDINLSKQDEDFGQTLGTYGLGQGFFINWPLFGPSSPRDTVGLVGDVFLTPSSYLSPWYAGSGIRGYGMVNDTSLKIGDYESLKEAAIDPYVAIRDAYVQYRLKKVNRKGGNTPAIDSGIPKQ